MVQNNTVLILMPFMCNINMWDQHSFCSFSGFIFIELNPVVTSHNRVDLLNK